MPMCIDSATHRWIASHGIVFPSFGETIGGGFITSFFRLSYCIGLSFFLVYVEPVFILPFLNQQEAVGFGLANAL